MLKTTIGIEGMACGMCESHISDTIRKNFDVKKVKASHTKKQAEVISEEALDEGKLKEVIAQTGYTVVSVESAPYEKKGLFSF